jgi:transcriptional regulator with PAS, ATPase and Fis domain
MNQDNFSFIKNELSASMNHNNSSNNNNINNSSNRNNNNKKDQIEWRRNKVQELLVKGNSNHYEIASILQVSRPTITRDIEYLRE